jgi:hypothetical protein
LAAWRTYDTAEQLSHLQGEASHANAYRVKKQNTIKKLLNSLQDGDPLRERLGSLIEINTLPVTIDSAIQINLLVPTDFNVSFGDAA